MPIRARPFCDRILPAPRSACFALPDYWVWCGSAVRGPDGRCHLFAARWPRHLPMFEGYIWHSEVVRAVADTPLGPYCFAEVVLPDRGARFWDGRMTHNPTILRWGDTYLLFYIGATCDGSKPDAEELNSGAEEHTQAVYRTIRIGLATAPSPEGPWQRRDAPILDPRPDHWDSTVITNPAPCLTPGGRLLLYYRSNTPDGCRIGVAASDAPDRPFMRLRDEPILADCHIEDPYVFWMRDHYELLAKDLSGMVTGEYHAGVHALSADGITWQLADPVKAYSRTIKWDDGSTGTLGSLERPQLLFEDSQPAWLFAAAADGPGGFRNASRTWNQVIPLKR